MKMERTQIYWFLMLILLLIVSIGLILEREFSSPPIRSAVYEIPMADRREPWRVTTYRNKVYVLIEAPSMPEEIIRKDGPTR